MFWTAFVWGLGVTVGGSLGLMLFVVLFAGWSWLMGTETAKRAAEVAELGLIALQERNNLTKCQLEVLDRNLDRIANCIKYQGEC